MKTFAIDIVQTALNKYLSLDSESAIRLQPLAGKSVTLQLRGVDIKLQMQFQPDTIVIVTDNFLAPDTTITGTPLRLLQMTFSKKRQTFFSEDVSIEGNLELGQQVINLFDQLDIDYEELLAAWVGDVPAHQIGKFARWFTQGARNAKDSACENVSEYVHEEVNFFPAKDAITDFCEDIDRLRLETDRLEARIKHIQDQLLH